MRQETEGYSESLVSDWDSAPISGLYLDERYVRVSATDLIEEAGREP